MPYKVTVSPKRNRPYDKFERSPTDAAKCKGCGRMIIKNEIRVGVQVKDYVPNDPWDKWIPRYYHLRCISSEYVDQLYLKSSCRNSRDRYQRQNMRGQPVILSEMTKGQLELDMHDQEKAQASLLVVKRHELRKRLQKCRKEIAEYNNKPLFTIFNDTALDEIVTRLPSNSKELLSCRFIGKLTEMVHGSWILECVRDWRNGTDTTKLTSPTTADISTNLTHKRILTKDLLEKRKEIARIKGVPPAAIFNKATFYEIVQRMPKSKEALLACKGIGPKKLHEHGDWIIKFIEDHSYCSSVTHTAPTIQTVSQCKENRSNKRILKEVVELCSTSSSVGVENTLTLNDKLHQQHLEAEKKGNVISLL